MSCSIQTEFPCSNVVMLAWVMLHPFRDFWMLVILLQITANFVPLLQSKPSSRYEKLNLCQCVIDICSAFSGTE